jgi:hypothetical protein
MNPTFADFAISTHGGPLTLLAHGRLPLNMFDELVHIWISRRHWLSGVVSDRLLNPRGKA